MHHDEPRGQPGGLVIVMQQYSRQHVTDLLDRLGY
jgi:hypothetical protein